MAKARRAKARPVRGAVLIMAALALVAVAAVAAWKFLPGSPTAAGPQVAASVRTTGPSTTPAAATTPTRPTARPTPSAVAPRALVACRTKVQAGDAVLEAGRVGIGHWTSHVRAQTEADAQTISQAQMEGRFTKSRLAGPADQQRYTAALRAYDDADGSCRAVSGADPTDAATLARCEQRHLAQQPVLDATAGVMADWDRHLRDMEHSRQGVVADPGAVWLAAWRAAPANIDRYAKAASNFRPPAC